MRRRYSPCRNIPTLPQEELGSRPKAVLKNVSGFLARCPIAGRAGRGGRLGYLVYGRGGPTTPSYTDLAHGCPTVHGCCKAMPRSLSLTKPRRGTFTFQDRAGGQNPCRNVAKGRQVTLPQWYRRPRSPCATSSLALSHARDPRRNV